MSELSCANNCLNRDEYLKSQNVAVLFAQHKAKTLEDKAKALEGDVTVLLKASAEGQQQLNELSNKNAQLQQQLETMEKALARSNRELAVFHELQEDASRSFPVAYSRVQIAVTKLMAVLEWTDTAGILQLEFQRRKTRALKDLRQDIVEQLGSAAYTLGDLKDQLWMWAGRTRVAQTKAEATRVVVVD